MASSKGNKTAPVKRICPAGVIPLELWDTIIPEGILWEQMNSSDLAKNLLYVVRRLKSRTLVTRSGYVTPAQAQDFKQIVITGGGATYERMSFFKNNSEWPVAIIEDAFVGEHGAQILFDEIKELLIVDLGQTSIKVSAGGKRFQYARDFVELPIRDDDESREITWYRDKLRDFTTSSIRDSLTQSDFIPNKVVFALPCDFDQNEVPGGSSYIGMKGAANLIPDILEHSNLTGLPTYVLNDAELAAVAARALVKENTEPILVITVGFGIGAAVALRVPNEINP